MMDILLKEDMLEKWSLTNARFLMAENKI